MYTSPSNHPRDYKISNFAITILERMEKFPINQGYCANKNKNQTSATQNPNN